MARAIAPNTWLVLEAVFCICLSCAGATTAVNDSIDSSTSVPSTLQECPCSSSILCQPLETARLLHPLASHVQEYERKKNKLEVFAFVLSCNSSVWSKFDWDKLTTIALAGFYDPLITCYAHKHGVKVVQIANPSKSFLPDPAARRLFVELHTSNMVLQFLDGLNVDFEDDIAAGSPEERGYTALIEELTDAVHSAGGQVSVDVAWSANGIDGRYYDYAALGNHADLLFVMAYDEQSQIWQGPCSARANSALHSAMEGVLSYTSLGIPASKLVLGLPWYGYKYNCTSFTKDGTCLLKKVPFRGCPCSDAAGREFPYSYFQDLISRYNITELWDTDTSTPYFNVQFPAISSDVIQVRYDNPHSLLYKTVYSRIAGLAGVGMWTANFLDNSDTAAARRQRDAMWGVMP